MNILSIISSGAKIAGRIGKEKAPELLMAAGTVAFGMTVVNVAKVAPEAEQKRKFWDDAPVEYANTGEKIEVYCREVVRYYVPAIGWGAVTLGCFWGSHILEKRKTAAAVLALGALDRSFAAYREEHPLEARRDSDYIPIEETPVPMETKIPGEGDTLYYDKVGMHWFYSTEGRIREGESRVNKELVGYSVATLNELYDYWGLDGDGYVGEALGFNDECPCDIIMRPTMTKDHKPAIALIYSTTVLNENQLRR